MVQLAAVPTSSSPLCPPALSRLSVRLLASQDASSAVDTWSEMGESIDSRPIHAIFCCIQDCNPCAGARLRLYSATAPPWRRIKFAGALQSKTSICRALSVSDVGMLTELASELLEPGPHPAPYPHSWGRWRWVSGEGSILWEGLAPALPEQQESGDDSCESLLRVANAVPSASREQSCLYCTLEPDAKEDAPAERLLQACRPSRVVLGLRSPFAEHGIRVHGGRVQLAGSSTQVDCLEDEVESPSGISSLASSAMDLLLQSAAPALHAAVLRLPLGVWKFASTLDGRTAAPGGDSRWVSGPSSRSRVHALRARCHAVVVGATTLTRDDPQLTTRAPGHQPVRMVMSRSLDLPLQAKAWSDGAAPTIVFTLPGARPDVQKALRDQGVQVVERPGLSPRHVAEYCFRRGWWQVLWECGGRLAAAALQDQVLHKIMAFVAPKVVGGGDDTTTVLGDCGIRKMNDAHSLCEVEWSMQGSDLLLTGYLPSSGGLAALHRRLRERQLPRAPRA